VSKAAELRGQSQEALEKQLLDRLKEQFNLRMQKGSGQLSRPSHFKTVRREIARIKTVLGEQSAARHAAATGLDGGGSAGKSSGEAPGKPAG
jgi:large subunit ribosomal protein L29